MNTKQYTQKKTNLELPYVFDYEKDIIQIKNKTTDKNVLSEAIRILNENSLDDFISYSSANNLNINCVDTYGNNFIHMVLNNNKLDENTKIPFIEYFVSGGCLVMHKNMYNETPLHLACKYQHTIIVNYLIPMYTTFDTNLLNYCIAGENIEMPEYDEDIVNSNALIMKQVFNSHAVSVSACGKFIHKMLNIFSIEDKDYDAYKSSVKNTVINNIKHGEESLNTNDNYKNLTEWYNKYCSVKFDEIVKLRDGVVKESHDKLTAFGKEKIYNDKFVSMFDNIFLDYKNNTKEIYKFPQEHVMLHNYFDYGLDAFYYEHLHLLKYSTVTLFIIHEPISVSVFVDAIFHMLEDLQNYVNPVDSLKNIYEYPNIFKKVDDYIKYIEKYKDLFKSGKYDEYIKQVKYYDEYFKDINTFDDFIKQMTIVHSILTNKGLLHVTKYKNVRIAIEMIEMYKDHLINYEYRAPSLVKSTIHYVFKSLFESFGKMKNNLNEYIKNHNNLYMLVSDCCETRFNAIKLINLLCNIYATNKKYIAIIETYKDIQFAVYSTNAQSGIKKLLGNIVKMWDITVSMYNSATQIHAKLEDLIFMQTIYNNAIGCIKTNSVSQISSSDNNVYIKTLHNFDEYDTDIEKYLARYRENKISNKYKYEYIVCEKSLFDDDCQSEKPHISGIIGYIYASFTKSKVQDIDFVVLNKYMAHIINIAKLCFYDDVHHKNNTTPENILSIPENIIDKYLKRYAYYYLKNKLYNINPIDEIHVNNDTINHITNNVFKKRALFEYINENYQKKITVSYDHNGENIQKWYRCNIQIFDTIEHHIRPIIISNNMQYKYFSMFKASLQNNNKKIASRLYYLVILLKHQPTIAQINNYVNKHNNKLLGILKKPYFGMNINTIHGDINYPKYVSFDVLHKLMGTDNSISSDKIVTYILDIFAKIEGVSGSINSSIDTRNDMKNLIDELFAKKNADNVNNYVEQIFGKLSKVLESYYVLEVSVEENIKEFKLCVVVMLRVLHKVNIKMKDIKTKVNDMKFTP